MASSANWLSARFLAKGFWVPVLLQTLKFHISRVLRIRRSETSKWNEKNIQSNAPYKQVLRTKLNRFTTLPKWLSVCLQAMWFWVRVYMQSFKIKISCILWARGSSTFRQLKSVDSRWSVCVIGQEHTVKDTLHISTQKSSIFWPFWPNGCVFVDELSDSGSESSSSNL